MENPLIAEAIGAVVNPVPGRSRFFLEGPVGAGKTTLAIRRLRHLLQSYVPAEQILVLVPQRSLGTPYRQAMWELDMPGGEVTVVTVGGLARRMIDLYWPIIGERAGFAHPEQPPIFLTLETTQYYMDRIVTPFVDAGTFDGLAIRRNRLASQIIDNLNKAAVVGFPHTEVATRLKEAWDGESAILRMYDQAQACVNGFRSYCLAHNLLDFSLQYDILFNFVLDEPACRRYLFEGYRHLIADNVEEDTPRAHDLLQEWLERCATALVVMDQDGGYRAFLGADAAGAAALKSSCEDWLALNQSYVTSPEIEALGQRMVHALGPSVQQSFQPQRPRAAHDQVDPKTAIRHEATRFQPQMLEWVADQIAHLVYEEDVSPDEIAVLAPFLGDALRFTLTDALSSRNIPVRSHRPSRALREEPATRCLLTLAALAHPDWEYCPAAPDVGHALMTAIDGLDLVRARLLTEIAYRPREGRPVLHTFDQIRIEMQERISYLLGERFDTLRDWLEIYAQEPAPELNVFVQRIFTEVLSQSGFGFHGGLDKGQVTSNLIESIRKFYQVVDIHGRANEIPLSLEYVRLVDQGIIAATYIQNWQMEDTGAVLMAPAYTFLMANRPVDIQFWLDIGSGGWWERLYQPLTHPYVLSRQWPAHRTWTDEDEFLARQKALGRLVLGLIRRCRQRIYLGISDLGEQGYEQRGPLLQIVQRVLRDR